MRCNIVNLYWIHLILQPLLFKGEGGLFWCVQSIRNSYIIFALRYSTFRELAIAVNALFGEPKEGEGGRFWVKNLDRPYNLMWIH